jgi:hypothetical protein
MNFSRMTLGLTLLLCICAADLTAQLNPVYLQIQKNRKAISQGRREVKQGLTVTEYYVDMGYDDATLARLKKVGVDVKANLFKRDLNEKEKAVRSDCIIIGTVVRLENPPAKPEGTMRPFYTTTAYVSVEEFLRNDYRVTKGVIPVLIESNIVGAITLKTDEHVLLFLSAWSVITNFEYNTSTDYYAKMIRDTTIRFEIMGFDGKYVFFSDKVWSSPERGSRSLLDVKKDVQAVVAAIKRPK